MSSAKEIMTRNVITINKDLPVVDAIKLLVEKGISGLPVVSDDMNLLGVVSEKDLLNLVFASNLEGITVEEFMTSEVTSFSEDADLLTICECLMQNNFKRVPILKDGKLTGIVSRRDLIKYILE